MNLNKKRILKNLNFGQKFLILALVVGLCSSLLVSFTQVLAQEKSNNSASLEQDYLKQKQEIQSKIDAIKENLDKISNSQLEVEKQKNTLNDQSNSIQKEKSEVDSMITDTKLVIGQVRLIRSTKILKKLSKKFRKVRDLVL